MMKKKRQFYNAFYAHEHYRINYGNPTIFKRRGGVAGIFFTIFVCQDNIEIYYSENI